MIYNTRHVFPKKAKRSNQVILMKWITKRIFNSLAKLMSHHESLSELRRAHWNSSHYWSIAAGSFIFILMHLVVGDMGSDCSADVSQRHIVVGDNGSAGDVVPDVAPSVPEPATGISAFGADC